MWEPRSLLGTLRAERAGLRESALAHATRASAVVPRWLCSESWLTVDCRVPSGGV